MGYTAVNSSVDARVGLLPLPLDDDTGNHRGITLPQFLTGDSAVGGLTRNKKNAPRLTALTCIAQYPSRVLGKEVHGYLSTIIFPTYPHLQLITHQDQLAALVQRWRSIPVIYVQQLACLLRSNAGTISISLTDQDIGEHYSLSPLTRVIALELRENIIPTLAV